MEFRAHPTPSQEKQLRAFGLTAICLGFFIVILDTSVVNVALPSVQHDLHGSLAGLQWVVNGYTLVFASVLLSAGTLGDRFGHKRTFLSGFLLFTGTSLLCSLAPTLPLLVAARVLQGIGPALLVPSSLSLITHGYQNLRERARAIGLWAGISGIALASGPIIGGVLVETVGWRSIFLLNIPFGVLAIVLTWYCVAETPCTTARDLDIWGQITAVLTLALLTYVLIAGRSEGWSSPPIVGSLTLCAATLGSFLLLEWKLSHPLLPLRLFALPTFAVTVAVGSIVNFGLYGVLFVFSLFFQDIQHDSAVLAGIAFLPLTAATGLTALLAGRVTARLGVRWPMMVGLGAASVGTLLLQYGGTDGGNALLVLGGVIIGFGCGMTIPAMTTAMLATVPQAQAGLASALLNASRQLGGVLGVAILGSLIGSLNDRSVFLTGMRPALLLVAAVFFCGFALLLSCTAHA